MTNKQNLIKSPTFVVDPNLCFGSVSENLQPAKPFILNLKIAPGLVYSRLAVGNEDFSKNAIVFKNQINYRIGFEVEYVLPFNKNKWSILLEPIISNYSSKLNYNDYKFDVNFTVREVSLGLRHYFFLKKGLKALINVHYTPAFVAVYDAKFEITNKFNNVNKFDVKVGDRFSVGLGLEHKRFSTEFRYNFRQDILRDYRVWDSNYSNLTFMIGYKILKLND